MEHSIIFAFICMILLFLLIIINKHNNSLREKNKVLTRVTEILDNSVRKISCEKPDRLQRLFNKQKAFNEQFLVHKLPNYIPEGLPVQVTALIAELGELLQSKQGWKTWKKNKVEKPRNEVMEEVADIWHFMINICLFLGFDANDVYDAFEIKNEINIKRQINGY